MHAREDIVLISLADAEYFKYLRILAISQSINLPDVPMLVFLVNCDKSMAREMVALNKNCHVEIEHKSFKSEHQKRCYCAQRRAYLFKSIRNSARKHMIWIDADSIIRKPCQSLIEHSLSCDFSAKVKRVSSKQKSSGAKFASGVLSIGVSPDCDLFIDYYYRACQNKKGKEINWLDDQLKLTETFDNLGFRLHSNPLPETYCDTSLSDESVIWAAKADLKYSQKYLKEMEKFERMHHDKTKPILLI